MAETSAAGEAQILYLEPDDEIPSVVRRVRESELPRLVLVAPGRSKATSSAIGLRLLARHANEVGRQLSLVADPAARTLAAEAGIPAFASIAEAQADVAGGDPAAQPTPRPLAAIHVVRGEAASPPAMPVVTGLPADVHGSPAAAVDRGPDLSRMEDTQAVPVAPPLGSSAAADAAAAAPAIGRALRRSAPSARAGRGVLIAILATVLVVAALVTAVLPSASVRITPSVASVGPVDYVVTLPAEPDTGRLDRTMTGNATGTYSLGTARATGTVVFNNFSNDPVQVAKGTPVGAGDQVFTTDKTVVIPAAFLVPGFAGQKSVTVTAAAAGAAGNVDSRAINMVLDQSVDRRLQGSPFVIGRRVANPDPTSGGTSKTGPQVAQSDVDGLVARIKQALATQLDTQLASHPERTYAPPSQPQQPQVTVPAGLVGTKDKATFQLTGNLAYDRRYVTADQVSQAASGRLSADTKTLPNGTMLVPDSVVASVADPQQLGDLVSATVTARGAVTRRLDYDELKRRIAGLSADDAAAALADVGTAKVDFWPGWVNAVPRLPFRIDISVQTPTPSASPVPLASAS